jgi:hypothetical protein
LAEPLYYEIIIKTYFKAEVQDGGVTISDDDDAVRATIRFDKPEFFTEETLYKTYREALVESADIIKRY